MNHSESQLQRIENCFFLPTDILPDAAGQFGFSVARTAIATGILAVSLALLKFPSSPILAIVVIPLWCAAAGTLVDGRRGFFRGIIFSIVFPIYATIVLAFCAGVYFLFSLMHMTISG